MTEQREKNKDDNVARTNPRQGQCPKEERFQNFKQFEPGGEQ